eukprot:5762874-Alexandrium_andersonii.AAC.1
MVHPIQAGGIAGRSMHDKIFEVEAKAIEYMIRRHGGAGVIALDQRAAFPTLSRKFLLWSLRKMKVPAGIRALVKNLYCRNRSLVCVGARYYGEFIATSGVKQGCPASMVLFVLAFDGIIRFISSRLGPGDSLSGYCDDLCVVTPELVATWGHLLKLFKVVSLVSSLCLNTDKTQIWEVVPVEGRSLIDCLREAAPGLPDSVLAL